MSNNECRNKIRYQTNFLLKKSITYFILSGFISLGFSQENGFVYKNDYDDQLLNPLKTETAYSKSYIDNGDMVYELTDSRYPYASFEYVPVNEDKEFWIETEIKASFSKIKQGSFGLEWGHLSNSNTNIFEVNEKNQFRIWRTSSAESFWLTEWTNTGLTPEEFSGKIKFTIHQSKGITTFYLNGKKKFECPAIKLSGYRHGYRVQTDIRCSYLYVKQNNGTVNYQAKNQKVLEKEHLETGTDKNSDELNPVVSQDGKSFYFARTSRNRAMSWELGRSFFKADLDDEKKPTRFTEYKIKNPGCFFEMLCNPPEGNNFTFSLVGTETGQNYSAVYSFTLKDNILQRNKKIYRETLEDTAELNTKVPSSISKGVFSSNRKAFIYSAGSRLNNVNQSDLFVVTRISDSLWTAPQKLPAAINTYGDEETPFLFYDDKTLYFSSNGLPGYGGMDVFVTTRLDNTWTNWSKPENLGPVINGKGWDGFYFISPSGEDAYMTSTYEFYNNKDLFHMKLSVKKEWVLFGKVLNKKTELPQEGTLLRLISLSTKKIIDSVVVGKTGEYKFSKLHPGEYEVKAESGILRSSLHIVLQESQPELSYNILISPPETGQSLVLHDISFEPNKYELLSSSFMELDKLVKYLKENKEQRIEIHGHTSVNSEGAKFNLQLSTNRAAAVRDYLVQNGIKNERITYQGFGFNEPIYKGTDEKEQSKNRRVEIIFLK